MKILRRKGRFGFGLALALGLAIASTGCSIDEFLDVDNPNELEAEGIDPERDRSLLSESVYQDFIGEYGDLPIYTAWFTNSLRVGDTFPTRNQVGRRDVLDGNNHTNGIWSGLHETLQFARSTFTSIEDAGNTLDLTRVKWVEGFTILLLAEHFCQGTIAENTLTPRGPMSVEALLDSAIMHLEQVQSIAAGVSGSDAARAQELATAAQVGIARAHLQAGRFGQALSAANQVPADFEYELWHLDDPNNRGLGNPVWVFSESRVSGVVGPEFRAMADAGDPRIAYVDMGRPAQDGILNFYRQDKYKGWGDNERFVSGLEARYIAAEADYLANGNEQRIVDLINERRGVGNQSQDFSSSDQDEIMSEFFDQKARDFWLEAKRVADWRRQFTGNKYAPTVDNEQAGRTDRGWVPYIIEPGENYYKDEVNALVRDYNCWDVPLSERNRNPEWPDS